MITDNEAGNNRYDIFFYLPAATLSTTILEKMIIAYGIYLDGSDYNTVIDNTVNMVRNTIIRLFNSNYNTISNVIMMLRFRFR
ncbi:MAG: NosD domain-containing protein [Methanolobus sp.]